MRARLLVKVKVRLDDIFAETRRAQEEFKRLPEQMKRIVDLGAAYERLSHRYRNRTGNLEQSTHSHPYEHSVRLSRVDLEMGFTPDATYAEWIVKRGFSNINDAVYRIDAELKDYFEQMAHRIAG